MSAAAAAAAAAASCSCSDVLIAGPREGNVSDPARTRVPLLAHNEQETASREGALYMLIGKSVRVHSHAEVCRTAVLCSLYSVHGKESSRHLVSLVTMQRGQAQDCCCLCSVPHPPLLLLLLLLQGGATWVGYCYAGELCCIGNGWNSYGLAFTEVRPTHTAAASEV
jgi:hypothetical protein